MLGNSQRWMRGLERSRKIRLVKSEWCQSGLFDEVLCLCDKKKKKILLVQARSSICSLFGVMGENERSSPLGKTFSVLSNTR